MKKAIVIIPTYNEKDNIEITVSAIFDVFAKINSWEMNILVVDDSSPDNTGKLVKSHKLFNKRLYLIERSENRGYAPS